MLPRLATLYRLCGAEGAEYRLFYWLEAVALRTLQVVVALAFSAQAARCFKYSREVEAHPVETAVAVCSYGAATGLIRISSSPKLKFGSSCIRRLLLLMPAAAGSAATPALLYSEMCSRLLPFRAVLPRLPTLPEVPAAGQHCLRTSVLWYASRSAPVLPVAVLLHRLWFLLLSAAVLRPSSRPALGCLNDQCRSTRALAAHFVHREPDGLLRHGQRQGCPARTPSYFLVDVNV